MNITLKMDMQDQTFEVEINMTMKAGRIYRQYFERDMIKDLAEIYRSANPSPYQGLNISDVDYKDKSEDEIMEMLINRVDLGKMIVARQADLDFEASERVSQILWSFAKNADPDLPRYEEWIDQFDFILPSKELITTLYNLWTKTAQPVINVKN